jgi:flagellar hook-associated protein 3 FlgL
MRVTNYMLINRAMSDLDGLRARYRKAQDAVNGRALERPSEDPQRVAEAMDLSGMKMRFERAQRAGQDAREWLSVVENALTAVIDRLEAAREVAVQAGSPVAMTAEGRESLARAVEAIRDSLKRELNAKHRDLYIFGGWKTDAPPFVDSGTGGVTYLPAPDQEITRDIAPGLSVVVNVPGNKLLAGGDFMKTLTDMANDLRSGQNTTVFTNRLQELDNALANLTVYRSDLGTRQVQVEQYEDYAQQMLIRLEDRLGEITGVDLETAVLQMTEAQTAYQAALASFAKALPTSLVEYMLR